MPAEPPRRTLTVLLGMLAMIGPASVDMYLPAMPTLAADLGATAAGTQMTLSSFFLGICAGTLIHGPLSDRFGRRWLLIIGLVLHGLASLACAFASAIDQLVVLRMLQAFGGAAGAVVARAICRDVLEGPGATRMLSLLMVAASLAAILSPTLGGVLVQHVGWRGIFVVQAGLAVAATIGLLLHLPETLPPDRRSVDLGAAARGYVSVFADAAARWYLLAGAAGHAGLFAYITGSPFVFIALFGLSEAAYGVLFGVNAAGILLLSLANARLAGRIGTPRLLRAGTTTMAVAGVLIATVSAAGGGVVAISVPILVFLSMVGVVAANAVSGLLDRFPRNAGAASALFGAGQFGGGALLAGLVGTFNDGTTTSMAWGMAVVGLTAAIAAWVATRPRSADLLAETPFFRH